MRNSISINAIVWHQHLICNTLSFSQLHERFPGLTISKDKISLHHLLLRVNNLGSAPKPDKQTQHRVGMSRWLLRVQKTNDVTPTGLHVSNILSNTDLLWMLLAQDWIKKTCVVYIEIEMPLDNMSTQKTNLPGGNVNGVGFSTGYYQLVVWLPVGSSFTNHNDMVIVSNYQWNGKIVTWFFVEQVPANERRRIERPGLWRLSLCASGGRKKRIWLLTTFRAIQSLQYQKQANSPSNIRSKLKTRRDDHNRTRHVRRAAC